MRKTRLALLYTVMWLFSRSTGVAQQPERGDLTAILSGALATENAIRPGEWHRDVPRQFTRVRIYRDRELVALRLHPKDTLTVAAGTGQRDQVFVVLWRDSSDGLLRMPIAPLSAAGLATQLREEDRNVWTDLGVKREHADALAASQPRSALETFTVPQTPPPARHDAEWSQQMALLAVALRAESIARSITNGVVTFRDFGVLDEHYVGAAYCDARHWGLRIAPLRDAHGFAVVRFDVVLFPIDVAAYDQIMAAIKRSAGSLAWTLHRGQLLGLPLGAPPCVADEATAAP